VINLNRNILFIINALYAQCKLSIFSLLILSFKANLSQIIKLFLICMFSKMIFSFKNIHLKLTLFYLKHFQKNSGCFSCFIYHIKIVYIFSFMFHLAFYICFLFRYLGLSSFYELHLFSHSSFNTVFLFLV
jgi:hypothetical protein